MKPKSIPWEALNAYVDGELSAADAAEIARAVMLDPQLAAEVAELSRLKAVTSELQNYNQPHLELEIPQLPRRWYSRAAIWLILPLATILLAGLLYSRMPTSNADMKYALAIHQQWLDATAENPYTSTRSAQFLKSSLASLNLNAYVPDLSSVDLSYAGIYPVAMPTGDAATQALHVGYIGPSGCKVSLLVSDNTDGKPSPLGDRRYGHETLYHWKTAETGFLLLASHMDAKRFGKIAQVIYRLSRIHSPLDASAIIALNQAKAASTPCTA